jgi:parallel beta-helix repeat protein/predicted outer membrane repeat protein
MHKISKRLKHRVLVCLTVSAFILLSAAISSAETTDYIYDDTSRLIRVEYEDGTEIDYVYDNMGNRMQKNTDLDGEPSNNPPYAATLTAPSNNAVEICPDTITFSFTSNGDPDSGDEVIHYLYLGPSGNLSLAASGWQSSFDVEQLEPATTYCWEIVSRDTHNADTVSDQWCFTTEQTDSDGDGIVDCLDTCPLDDDNDHDSDGVCGNVDNCPDTPNPYQDDRDSDGIGDLCDSTPGDPITWDVGPGFPMTAIQTAIDRAIDGDTILVYDGTYVENINFKGKAVHVKSKNGADVTIIDGNAAGSVVTFNSEEGENSVLDGFTIRNGFTNSKGGGIYCYYSSPTITDCTISGNSASSSGGGIYCSNSSPVITDCTISGNSASSSGGGIYCTNSSSPAITNCTISGNSASSLGGGIYCLYSPPVITNCVIFENSAGDKGGGIHCAYSSPAITNCTISGNSANSSGGGIYCAGSSSNLQVVNSILWNNSPNEIILGGYPSISVSYSDVEGGYTGTGNINSDPLFKTGDYHLSANSPCIDAGTDDAGTYPNLPGDDIEGDTRPQGEDYDMGVDEVCTDTDDDGYYATTGCGTLVDCDDNADSAYPSCNGSVANGICDDDITFQSCTVGNGQTIIYNASDTITADSSFTVQNGANITFQADNSITLSNGFIAEEGSTFRAYIE